MSTMLEQAIIDAASLREAAIKNAESTIVEKYSDEIKQAVEALLEQDEDIPPVDLGTDVPDEQGGDETVDQAPLASLSEDDEVVTVKLDDLKRAVEQELESDGELDAAEMIDRDEEVAPELADTPDLAPEEPAAELDEEIEFDEDGLDKFLEELTVDTEPVKTGWLETPTSRIAEMEDEAEALEKDDTELEEDSEEENSLNESLLRQEKRNDVLNEKLNQLVEENNRYRELILQLKDTINEVNVENARLVYMNKAFDGTSLNERQKEKVAEAISKASTVEEAKIIYETLQSTVGSTTLKERKRPESLGEAINRRSSTTLSNRREAASSSPDPSLDRLRKLAGIS